MRINYSAHDRKNAVAAARRTNISAASRESGIGAATIRKWMDAEPVTREPRMKREPKATPTRRASAQEMAIHLYIHVPGSERMPSAMVDVPDQTIERPESPAVCAEQEAA